MGLINGEKLLKKSVGGKLLEIGVGDKLLVVTRRVEYCLQQVDHPSDSALHYIETSRFRGSRAKTGGKNVQLYTHATCSAIRCLQYPIQAHKGVGTKKCKTHGTHKQIRKAYRPTRDVPWVASTFSLIGQITDPHLMI